VPHGFSTAQRKARLVDLPRELRFALIAAAVTRHSCLRAWRVEEPIQDVA